MNEYQFFQSKVKDLSIDAESPTYTWTDPPTGKQITANRYRVEFHNAHKLIFLAVGSFKYKVGQLVDYKTKDFKFGKLVKKENADVPKKFNTITYNQKNVKLPENTQTYIIRQNSASNACNFYARRLNTTTEEIITLARELENYVLNG